MISGMGVAQMRSMPLRSGQAGVLAALIASGGACSAPARQADFASIDPSERSAAAAQAASARDASAVPDLIAMLESSDPAARMVAIAALERITGERLGFDPAGSRPDRQAAVRRWVRYAIDNGYASGGAGAGGGGV